MIKSTLVKLNKPEKFDNIYIENELSKLYSSVIRWAVVKIENETLTVCVSFEF